MDVDEISRRIFRGFEWISEWNFCLLTKKSDVICNIMSAKGDTHAERISFGIGKEKQTFAPY